MSGKWHGGKGDARRKGANDRKYRAGWERIFSQKNTDSKNKK
jgi:hypothetical protein